MVRWFIGLALAVGCGGERTELEGGVLATFQVVEDEFRLFVTNSAMIEALFALEAGTSTASIPIGPIVDGPGVAEHNDPWTWHLDPALTEMAEITIELCDATPSYVEENKAEFLDNVGQYCPWSAQLSALEDLR